MITPQVAEDLLAPLEQWAFRCHEASLRLLNLIDWPARVARGSARGVGGQHSWLVVGMDAYDDDAIIIDPTLWSYVDEVEGVFMSTYRDSPYEHRPHGKGLIWNWGRPVRADESGEEALDITPEGGWSDDAQVFIDMLGPLGRTGWIQLAHAPVEGWPSKEILAVMWQHPQISAHIPIDIAGMATDLNPSALYLRQ